MKTSNKWFFNLALALLIPTSAFCQEKFERESRMSTSDLPNFALDFDSTFEDHQSMKWYLEEGLERYSIEAKYKREGKRFSVEFDTLGILEDVEIEIEQTAIPKTTFDSICERLKADGKSYKIDKIQIQFTGDQSVLEKVAKSGESEKGCVIRYELVVRMRKGKNLSSFEYLFSENGTMEKRSEIIIQTSSNLEY